VHALVGMGTHIAAALAHARLHATIEKERTRLRAVLDQLPEGILIAETSGGAISYANPAATQILGISTEEITRIPLHRHSWLRSGIETTREGRPLPPWNFIAIRALSGETFTGKEATVMQPDGRRIVTLASCAPLYSERGLMTGAVIVLQDVTAQKTLEQHKNEFFSIANHELRTPITVIQGFSEILQLRASQENSFDKLTLYALTNIVEQSHHLTHLIEEMLDIHA
jgi:PAS domain S-box-containing protein